nr:hypothetical protein [Tanacetum cinerariifolium]
METYEVSERYISPCFMNGLEAYDGESNLAFDKNMISNEYAVKLCLDYEVKKGEKLVKKELIVALKGEIYFVKFIINLEEDDVEPGIILGRSFMRIAKGIVDFDNGVITIYPKPNLFEEDYELTEKSPDDWDQFFDFNFDDVPKFGKELPSLVSGRHLTQEEAVKEALAIRISQKFALLGKQGLGRSNKRITGKALKEKDDPEAFIFPIRLEEKVNENVLADNGSDLNTMSYRFYETLGREEMKKVDRGIKMINHTQATAMRILTNVLCQVGVPTLIAKTAESDSDDEEESEIKRNQFAAPIYGLKPAPYLNGTNPTSLSLAIQAVINLFWKISVWKKAFSFLGSLPVPLKQVNLKPDYKGCDTKEEEAT